MNWHVTSGNTRGPSHSSARSVIEVSPVPIIWLSIWNVTSRRSEGTLTPLGKFCGPGGPRSLFYRNLLEEGLFLLVSFGIYHWLRWLMVGLVAPSAMLLVTNNCLVDSNGLGTMMIFAHTEQGCEYTNRTVSEARQSLLTCRRAILLIC